MRSLQVARDGLIGGAAGVLGARLLGGVFANPISSAILGATGAATTALVSESFQKGSIRAFQKASAELVPHGESAGLQASRYKIISATVHGATLGLILAGGPGTWVAAAASVSCATGFLSGIKRD